MLRVAVALLILVFSGCAARVAKRDFEIVRETPTYAIGRSGNTYLIFAKTNAEVSNIADSDLHCKKEICIISVHGVVLRVDKPAEKPRQ